MLDDSESIDQKYLDGVLSDRRFRKQILDKDLDKAILRLKKYMTVTGILTENTMPLIDIVIYKMKQESI
jgi:hypothetical protein